MSKPNVKRVDPKPDEAGQPVTSGEGPDPKKEAIKARWKAYSKLPAAQKAAVRIGHVVERILATEGLFAGYSKDIADALGNSRKWAENAKSAAEKLPADFKAPRASRAGAGAELAVGAVVTIRDRRRETYAGILSPEELAKGVPVKGVHGSMVSVQTARGLSFLPKAHVKQAGAGAPA